MERNNKRWGFLMAMGIMLLFWAVEYGILMLAFGIQAVILASMGKEVTLNDDVSTLQIFVTLASTVVFLWIAWAKKWVLPEDYRKKGMPGIHALLLVVMLLGTSFGVSTLAEFMGLPDFAGDIIESMVGNPWGVLAISIVGPIGEELLFRETAIPLLQKNGWSASGAIFISALLFGITHMNPVQIFYAGILGLMLGWVFVRTKSILPCMGLHILNNLLSVILFYCSDTPDATYVEMFGTIGAVCIMTAGLVTAGLIFYYLRNRLKEMY